MGPFSGGRTWALRCRLQRQHLDEQGLESAEFSVTRQRCAVNAGNANPLDTTRDLTQEADAGEFVLEDEDATTTTIFERMEALHSEGPENILFWPFTQEARTELPDHMEDKGGINQTSCSTYGQTPAWPPAGSCGGSHCTSSTQTCAEWRTPRVLDDADLTEAPY